MYTEYGQERKIEIVEPCPVFSNHPSLNPYTLLILWRQIISKPLRCTKCSRRVERNIIRECEIKNAQYKAKVESLTRELRAEMDVDRRGEVRRRRRSELVRSWGI